VGCCILFGKMSSTGCVFGCADRYSILLEGGIAACHIVWLARSRAVRHQAKEQGKTFDEFLAECAQGDPGFAFRERVLRGKKTGGRTEQC
jgi:hypothetical protein